MATFVPIANANQFPAGAIVFPKYTSVLAPPAPPPGQTLVPPSPLPGNSGTGSYAM